jgi:sigma-B regulation protein RsbU (phosphoserine phosphatase)
MLIHTTDFSNEPLHRQICQQLMAKILTGDLQQGAELQPVHLLAREQRISVNTVERAYQDLAREGLITYANGAGACVNALSAAQKQALATHCLFGNAQESRRLEEELMMAQKIQARLLPGTLPNHTRLQLAAYSEASRPLGGDYYDCLPLDTHRFGLVIADACGKGLPAAMLICQIQAIIKNEICHGSSLRQALQNLNQYVKRYSSARHFVTLFYGIFDERTGVLEFANAGHNHPILTRNNGQQEFLQTTGPALGVLAEANHQIQMIKINGGDGVLFYTDGVTETMNRRREEFGEQRLQNFLVSQRRRSAAEMIRLLIEDLNSFRASAFLQDDRTMMMLKVAANA